MKDANYWIKALRLSRHPEGGYFRETYRSGEVIANYSLLERYDGERCFSTSIHFLLRGDEVSRLHRLKSDELWHFYEGSPLTIHIIDKVGDYSTTRLGSDFEKGQVFQIVIQAGCWFGASVDALKSYSLVGCTVAPGFEFDDFELGNRENLIGLYPQHKSIIEMLTP